jgi:ketosteroid isomerase-like protein
VRAKLVIATTVGLAIAVMAWVSVDSRALASNASDKAEIVALNQRLTEAMNGKDLNAMMACYVNDEDAVFFVDTIPFEVKGTSAWRKINQEFFGSASQVHMGIEAIVVVVSGDLAATHSVVPLTWTDKNGAHTERGRYTQVLKKVGGKWLIWHEHFSVPYDPATGKAVLEASP